MAQLIFLLLPLVCLGGLTSVSLLSQVKNDDLATGTGQVWLLLAAVLKLFHRLVWSSSPTLRNPVDGRHKVRCELFTRSSHARPLVPLLAPFLHFLFQTIRRAFVGLRFLIFLPVLSSKE